MKKQKKQFFLLIVLLLICIGAFLAAKLYNSRQEEKEKAEEETAIIHVTDISEEDITAFSYVLNGETLAFTYEEGAWIYAGDTSVDIDEAAINTMLKEAVSITAEEQILEYSKLEDYGLQEPANEIELKTKDSTITIMLGNQNVILEKYYLMTSESENIYLVQSSLGTTFNKSIEELTVEEADTASENTQTEE